MILKLIPEAYFSGAVLHNGLGGMGIIMLFIAILPKLGVAGRQLFRAEAPGPTEDKIKPRIRETAKILWLVYCSISLLEVVALLLAGMSFYDALTHTFTTMACGGFSPYGLSVAAFNSPLIEGIITLFMFVSGANFALHYRTLYTDRNSLVKDDEFKFYAGVTLIATAILTFSLWKDMGETDIYIIQVCSFPGSFYYDHDRICNGGFQFMD